MALETLAPSTDRRFGSRADRIDWGNEDDGVAPDTVREHAAVSGTVPLPARSARPGANETAPLAPAGRAAPVITAPLLEPVLLEPLQVEALPARVSTEPLAAPAHVRPTLTYEIYTPDDTLRGRPAVRVDGFAETRRRRIALGILAFAVAVVTTLAGLGSCEESPTGHVETTSATLTPVPVTTTANANASANAIPAITFAPPLTPVPSAQRRRTPVPHPLPKRIP